MSYHLTSYHSQHLILTPLTIILYTDDHDDDDDLLHVSYTTTYTPHNRYDIMNTYRSYGIVHHFQKKMIIFYQYVTYTIPSFVASVSVLSPTVPQPTVECLTPSITVLTRRTQLLLQ